MKLIKQSFELIEQQDFSLIGIKKFIERCGRVCYKSEDRITDTSYEKFVNMLENNHHDRPLEFGTVHLKMDFYSYDVMINTLINKDMYNQLWIRGIHKCDNVHITTNYRYYLTIKKVYPDVEKFFTEEDNKYFPKRHTVHFITNRAIVDEFRTHVGLSHLAESTRYCSYDKDRFSNQITFIIPNWLDFPEGIYSKRDIYMGKGGTLVMNYLNAAEDYFLLRNSGATPQEARDVLPLGVKSELISCGFEDAWNNFFYRRYANDAHPMAREIAKSIHEEFIRRGFISE